MPSRVPLIERLGDKFVFAADGCWIWTAALSTSGYGKIYDAQGEAELRTPRYVRASPRADRGFHAHRPFVLATRRVSIQPI